MLIAQKTHANCYGSAYCDYTQLYSPSNGIFIHHKMVAAKTEKS